MSNYFVIDKDTNIITNVIVWDGISNWRPEEHQYIELTVPYVGIGFKKVDGQWVDTRPVIEQTEE